MSDFKLPDLGENIESGDVVSLLVSEGDTIQAQQDVIEIETDKAVIAVPSDVGGKVTKIHVARGQAVKPGQVILSLQPAAAGIGGAGQSIAGAGKETGRRSGEISRPGSETPAPAKPSPPAAAKAPSVPAKSAAPAAKATTTPTKARPTPPPPSAHDENGHSPPHAPESSSDDDSQAVETATDTADMQSSSTAPAGPAVRRLARELGVDLSRVRGTGPDGRITRDDVINAVRHANAAAGHAAAGRAGGPRRLRHHSPRSDVENSQDHRGQHGALGHDDSAPDEFRRRRHYRSRTAAKGKRRGVCRLPASS